MKIGILGGTFNPIHNGHISLARQAKDILALDKIIFMPAYIPPHKQVSDNVGAEDRFNMAKIATQFEEGFEVSRLEIDSKEKSYSVNTLERLKALYPQAEIFFIAGSDALSQLKNWKEIDRVLGLSHFTVATRPGYEIKDIPSGVSSIKIKPLDISSTDIRRRIKTNESIEGLIPDGVIEYINKKSLYK